MTEKVRFYFDPLCPWAWQASKWMRDVERVRQVSVEWRFFSLDLVNRGKTDPEGGLYRKGTRALRTLVLVERELGNEAVGAAYEALGRRVHDGEEPISPRSIRASLAEAGIDPDLFDRAQADPSTMEDLRAEFEDAVADHRAFGVPTIVLPSGRAMYGPIISVAPSEGEAGELWDHVRWLIERDGFFELKRERDRKAGETR